MKRILAALTAAAVSAVFLFSCGEPTGPLQVSNPTESILTVTLEETGKSVNIGRNAITLIDGEGQYQVDAVWTQCPDDDFAWYTLYRSGNPGIESNPQQADTSVVFSSVSSTSWTDTDVNEGQTYYYAIRTVNESDLDSWSNEESIALPPAQPPEASTLTGSYTGDGTFGQITLSWTQCPDDDFSSYRLYRSETQNIQADTSQAETVCVNQEPDDTSYEDNSVEGLTTYYYAVRTIDETQLCSWSNEISVTTPDLTPRLTVFFIDPSHNNYYSGDVILIKTPGNSYYLIDGGDRSGSWSCGIEKVLPLLDSLGVDSLDGIVGTHPHSDHIGGLIGVLENIPVDVAWDSGWPYSGTATYEEYLQAIYNNGSNYVTPRRGDILNWDDDLTVECLHPVEPLSTEPNNASIVLRITYGDVSFLFTGDLETDGGEEDILSALSQGTIDDISADVLKVGHHGSYTSTSLQWLQAVNPDYAAIEVGYGNPYGHPHNEVIQRLENYGIVIYRTDQDGTFIFTTDGSGIEILP